MDFEKIKDKTFGKRGRFKENEIAGIIGFCEHMRNSGHQYIIHPFIAENLDNFANEGFVAIHTEPPELGILYVKFLSKKGFFGNKYKYQMYITGNSDLTELKKHYEYPSFFKSFKDISLIREGMKI